MGYELDVDRPHTFNEKIQWLKLHDHNPLYSTMVDKYDVKKFVIDKIGEEYVIPTFGVWDNFDDVNFDKLPEQFVLKTTHDGAGHGVFICKDKSKLDISAAKERITNSLNENHYLEGRHWAYKNVKPRILAEKYMEDSQTPKELRDYKIFCFNGKAEFLYVSEGWVEHKYIKVSYLTLDWKPAPFRRKDSTHPYDVLPPRPANLDKMIEIAECLSQDVPVTRIDLYEVNGKIYFGEITLYPTGGFHRFEPFEYDLIYGDMIKLPNDIAGDS